MSVFRQCHPVLKTAILLSGWLGCLPAWSLDERFRDLSGRVEYAFYAEDSRALQRDLQAMAALEINHDFALLQQNQLDYGRWKLVQLQSQISSVQAQQLAEDCVDSKLPANSTGTTAALHFALHAACLSELAQLRPVRSVLYRRERDSAFSQALKLDARSIQVRLVGAWLKYSNKEPVDSAELKTLVAAYDKAASGELNDNLLWGQAEACFLLGQAEIAKGNVLAARNALERAILLAPEYPAAQALLRSLTVK